MSYIRHKKLISQSTPGCFAYLHTSTRQDFQFTIAPENLYIYSVLFQFHYICQNSFVQIGPGHQTLLCLLWAGCLCWHFPHQVGADDIEDNYDDTEVEYDDVEVEYDDIEDEYDDIGVEYDDIQDEYDDIEGEYRVSLKKGSFRIPAPMEALGYSKGLDISQKHCQTSFFG